MFFGPTAKSNAANIPNKKGRLNIQTAFAYQTGQIQSSRGFVEFALK